MMAAVALGLYLLVYANLGFLFDAPLLYAVLPVLGIAAALFALQRAGRAVSELLLLLNQLTLLVVAVALVGSAWAVLGDSAPVVVGRLLPLFIATVALYAYHGLLAERAAPPVAPLAHAARLLSGPALLPTLCFALITTACLVVVLGYLGTHSDAWRDSGIPLRVLERGIIPPLTIALFLWALLLLLHKSVLSRQLRLQVLPEFPQTASAGERQLLWRKSEESFLLPRYLVWAIPILGFIGTVLGISLAADGIRRLVSSERGISELSDELGQAIAPLGIAFDTTLIALSLSVVLMLVLTLAQRAEEDLVGQLSDRLEGAADESSR